MTVGQRIRYRREELKMSQEELAKRIGYKSRSSINKIELDLYNLKQSKIKSIADALATTPAYIMGWNENTKSKGVEIQVLGTVPAGIPVEAINDIIGTEEITREMAAQGEFFGLRVKGDSMLPDLKDNDIVIIRKQSDADSGDVVVALVNGYDATVKKLKKRPEGIMLIPNNSQYDTMFYSKEDVEQLPVSIIGKVVESRRKY